MNETEKYFLVSDHLKRWSALNVKMLRILFVLNNCTSTKDLETHIYLKEYFKETETTKNREKKNLQTILNNLAL